MPPANTHFRGKLFFARNEDGVQLDAGQSNDIFKKIMKGAFRALKRTLLRFKSHPEQHLKEKNAIHPGMK